MLYHLNNPTQELDHWVILIIVKALPENFVFTPQCIGLPCLYLYAFTNVDILMLEKFKISLAFVTHITDSLQLQNWEEMLQNWEEMKAKCFEQYWDFVNSSGRIQQRSVEYRGRGGGGVHSICGHANNEFQLFQIIAVGRNFFIDIMTWLHILYNKDMNNSEVDNKFPLIFRKLTERSVFFWPRLSII